jgi:Zn ribbon nucleic-acid-binding protein
MPLSHRTHATCPYCESSDVARLYLGSVHLDSCECSTCGARWDEDPTTGAFRGRATRSSVVVPRDGT